MEIQKSNVENKAYIQEVIIKDIHMSFGSMITFMVKWALASIPALIIVVLIITFVFGFLRGLIGSMIGSH